MSTLDLTTPPATRRGAARLGFWAAILTVVVALVFAAIAMPTPPRAGPFCASGCVAYPYTDVAQFIPGDYLWLVPGILLAAIFVVLMGSIHAWAAEPKRIYSRIGLSFAVVYAVLILVDYFVQLTVVLPSLQAGETDGLSLFTQYDPHGLFIALEALGYAILTIALLFVAPAFAGGRAERAIRWLFVSGFVLMVAAFVRLAVVGQDLVAFEVTVLTITWAVLIASGALLGIVFRRASQALEADADAEPPADGRRPGRPR